MQISPIQQNNTSFGSSVDLINTIPSLNPLYTTKVSKQNTVAILGSSTSSEPLEKYLKASSDITRHFIENGFSSEICSVKPIPNSDLWFEKVWNEYLRRRQKKE